MAENAKNSRGTYTTHTQSSGKVIKVRTIAVSQQIKDQTSYSLKTGKPGYTMPAKG